MKLNHLILAIGFLATFDCYAGTIDCLDTINHEFEYHFSASDGGAYLPPSESLIVKGETLIHRSPYDEQEIIKASVDFRDASAKIIKTAISDNKNFKTVIKVTKVVVKNHELGVEYYDDLVTCKSRQYIGIPLP